MSHLVRIAGLVAVFAAAGCVSNAEEVAQTSSSVATEASSLYQEMHAAIPASRTQGNVFEYN
jgi:outer membrane murein-binding lipoprotein Lpp